MAIALPTVGCLAAVIALLAVQPRGAASMAGYLAMALIGLLTAGLAVVIGWRVPDNVVGPLLGWVGFVIAAITTRELYYASYAADPDRFPLDPHVPAVLFESAWWLLAAIALLLLYFPDGRLPGPRWRWVPPVLVGCVAVTQAYGAVDPAAFAAPLEDVARPWGPPPLAVEIVSMVAFGLMLVLFLASGASLVVRYRRAQGWPGRSSSGWPWAGWPRWGTRWCAWPRSR